ncbi:MAG: hypothetical protein HYV63_16765 [Candidatus Schekmanbacteria bacterium]|nr:hypothetical protein [Candidatus Schekmanbacteria bacterium]
MLLAVMAIVVQDQVPLRAAATDRSPASAMLWQGDTLEVRGERLDFLQVYDHRRERGGYVKAWQVRPYAVTAEETAELLAIVRFLREKPMAEALGIGYTALYMKAAPATAIGPEIFDALGTFADRLAARAGSGRRRTEEESAAIAAHLEVAASYGLRFDSIENASGKVVVCYDGDAFQRVLAAGGASTALQRVRAALGLTRPECVPPELSPVPKTALDTRRAEALDAVDLTGVPDYLRNRVHMRRAVVWSGLAFAHARRGDATAVAAATRSIEELAAVNKSELADSDGGLYTEAAVRVGASRWGVNGLPSSPSTLSFPVTGGGGSPGAPAPALALVTAARAPGETCVRLVSGQDPPLVERCTYGVVWPASSSVSPAGTAVALAVQPLAGWRELWLLRRSGEQWTLDVVPPGIDGPDTGYIEFAGWLPDDSAVLTAREARENGRFSRSFEILNLQTLVVDRKAESPEFLTPFYKWRDVRWRQATIAVR